MIDNETQKALNDHTFFEKQKCAVCEGEPLIIRDPVAMQGVDTPIKVVISLNAIANVYSPASCQACGFTYFLRGEWNHVKARRVKATEERLTAPLTTDIASTN